MVRYVERAGDTLSRARAAEKPFELIDRESGALIAGVVDLLERADDSALPSHREIIGLVDFKASRIRTVEEYEATADAALEQLQLYAVGVRYAFDMEPAVATARILSPRIASRTNSGRAAATSGSRSRSTRKPSAKPQRNSRIR